MTNSSTYVKYIASSSSCVGCQIEILARASATPVWGQESQIHCFIIFLILILARQDLPSWLAYLSEQTSQKVTYPITHLVVHLASPSSCSCNSYKNFMGSLQSPNDRTCVTIHSLMVGKHHRRTSLFGSLVVAAAAASSVTAASSVSSSTKTF